MNRRILIALFAVLAFSACRKESLDLVNPNSRICKTYLQQFETVWEGMDQSYMFWELDTVDWDARYEEYQPVFAAFDARGRNNPVTQQEFQQAWSGVFEGLLDHHLTARMWDPKGESEAWVQPGKNDYSHRTDRNSQLSALRSQPGITQLRMRDVWK